MIENLELMLERDGKIEETLAKGKQINIQTQQYKERVVEVK